MKGNVSQNWMNYIGTYLFEGYIEKFAGLANAVEFPCLVIGVIIIIIISCLFSLYICYLYIPVIIFTTYVPTPTVHHIYSHAHIKSPVIFNNPIYKSQESAVSLLIKPFLFLNFTSANG